MGLLPTEGSKGMTDEAKNDGPPAEQADEVEQGADTGSDASEQAGDAADEARAEDAPPQSGADES
jgi:hypothetical protein